MQVMSAVLHELHCMSKNVFVSPIKFIRSKLSNLSAHVSEVNNTTYKTLTTQILVLQPRGQFDYLN